MHSVKTFLITFLSSVCIVMLCFAALYHMITPSTHSAGKHQSGVPITRANSNDNKTTLVSLQCESNHMFMLIKLNAVDKKVYVTAIPSDYYISHSSRTMQQSFEYAGTMQCVEDLSRQLDIVIDYHIHLDKETLPAVIPSFITAAPTDIISTQTPLQTASYTADIIANHTSEIQSDILPLIPQKLSYLSTNIGKTEAARLDRILTLLQQSPAEYICDALKSQH